MKTQIYKASIAAVFAVLFGFNAQFSIVFAQNAPTIYPFANPPGSPYVALTLGPDGNFYGTTENGGSGGDGTVFQMTTNGVVTTLASFALTNGANPEAALTLGADGIFYGTTENGGSDGGYGTVFQVTTNGTLTTLVSFNETNGAYPYAGLTLGPDGNFYGTTFYAGSGGYGTVFQVTTNGTLTTLVSFNGDNGANPYASLTPGPDGNFYGTTSEGGSDNDGTVFEVTTNGALTTLASFDYDNGALPHASLTLGTDGNFYGTTEYGIFGNAYGTVFQITTNGALTTLTGFDNTNGATPVAGLALGPDGNFYGTTEYGGIYGDGTVFQMTTNGVLTTLASFDNTNGAGPNAALTLGTNGNFYGTTEQGGSGGNGEIYRLDLWPFFTSGLAGETVPIGDAARFTVSPISSQPPFYQWYFNNSLVAGATNATLAISPALTNNDGFYQVVVTNVYGSATSAVATLNVVVEPNIYGFSNNSSSNSATLSLASYPGSLNYVYAATNLTLPFSQWQLMDTFVAGTNGLFQFVDSNTKNAPAKFYRLTLPLSISSVSAIEAEQTQTITTSGSGFGIQSPYDGDSDYIKIEDVTANWNGGYLPTDNAVTLNVTSWTDSQIVISGFTGDYGEFGWTLNSGDEVIISVWNAQTGAGPATYTNIVQ